MSDYIFIIGDLLTGAKTQAHGRRLKFFSNASFEVTEDLEALIKEHLEYQQGELLTVDSIDDIRARQGIPELQVSWKGFWLNESDWVTMDSLKEDVPVLVNLTLKEALDSFAETGTARQRAFVQSL